MICKKNENRNPATIIMLMLLLLGFIAVALLEHQWLASVMNETTFGTKVVDDDSLVASAVSLQLLPEPDLKRSLQGYDMTVTRPLFVDSRAPYVAPREEPASVALGQFELTGVLMAGDVKLALLKHKETGQEKSVALGKSINGWELVSVEKKGIVIRLGDVTEEVLLVTSKSTQSVKRSRSPKRSKRRQQQAEKRNMHRPHQNMHRPHHESDSQQHPSTILPSQFPGL